MSESSSRGAPDPRTLLRLDRQGSGALPLHEQVYRQLRARIESGTLVGGARLPAARVVAAELGVARNTVDAALLRLQQDGLIVRRAGAGSVVAEGVAIIAIAPLTRFVRVHSSGRLSLKVYTIAAQGAFFGDDVVAAALRTVLAAPHDAHDAGATIAPSADARLAEPAGIGSLVIQRRRDDMLAMLGLWQSDGLLRVQVWTAAAGQSFGIDATPATVLTPDAVAVFMHEAGAWQRHAVSIQDGDADAAWAADVLET